MCRGPDDRSIGRIAGAAVVAVGLVFGASLYHLPGDRTGVVLGEEDPGSLSTLPDRLGAVAANQLIDFTATQLPTLAHLADILQKSFPSVRTEVFLSAVEKHGLPQIVRTLEVLASAGFAMPVSAVLFSGGGGGGGARAAGSPIGLADLELLWQYLMQQLPAAMLQGLTDVVAAFIPASAGAAQVQHAVQVLSVAAPPAPAPPPVAPSSAPPPPPPSPPPPPPPSAVATPTPPPAPPPPPVVSAPPPVDVPAPPTVETSTPPPPPVTPEVTPEVTPAPEPDDVGDSGTGDNGNPGAGDDSGPGEDPSGGSEGDGSGTQDGAGSGNDTSHGGDAGPDGGQGAGGAPGPDNGTSGGGSGESGSDGG